MATTARRSRGLLITFEGIEGSGKTTQLAGLAKVLREEGYRVVETREPGGTPLAEHLRNLLLRTPNHGPDGAPARLETISVPCETSLILAARSQHVLHVVQPALKQGAVVLCDRFTDSTLAYQGYGRGLDLPYLRRANRFATGGLIPDLTLLFDLPVSSGLARRRLHRGEQNRLDRETERFHRSVRAGFLRLAAREPRRIRRIDARKDMDAVAQDVAALVTGFLRRRRHRPVGGFR